MKSLTVQLDEISIDVEKLPLGKYADLLTALDQLPKQLDTLTGLSQSEILPKLPLLIGNSIDDVVRILVLATSLSEEEIKALALDEVIKLLVGVVEVNKYGEIFGEIKKLFARPTQQPVMIPDDSTGSSSQ